MRKIVFIVCGAAALMLHSGCERVDTCPGDNEEGALPVSLEDVALLLSEINIGEEQLREVSDAVSSSSENGYDEEYTMRDLFSCPGAGVGDSSIPGKLKSGESGYRSPMRDMIREHLLSGTSVLSKSMPKKREAFTSSVDVFLKALESSDIQIYWPFSEEWDGESLPVITFDPCDGSETNIGYRAVDDGSGVRTVEEVIVDERFASEYPEIAARYYGKLAQTSANGVVALNTMLAQDGFVVYVPKHTVVERPIQLVNIFRSDVDTMANRRILFIVEENAEARLLVCDHSIDDVKFFSNQVIEIFAGANARADYYDLEESSVSTTRFSNLFVRQEAHSSVVVNGVTLTNGLTRNNYFVSLEGEGADLSLCGMSVLDKEQQLDTYSLVHHKVPHCTCNELFKNVLNDRAIGAFSGRILVEQGADKTEAYQTNRNLCATRECRMYSKPQLEIYADDVKCSHGMSTGQLDENALFYMQSRGISRDEARMLLSVAFTSDVIEHVRLEALKDRLHKLVEKRFRGELAKCAGCRICK